MGTSSALELARAGVRVTVLEKALPGAEASSAAAGIVGAEVEAIGSVPLLELSRKSRRLYPTWVRQLVAATSLDVGFRERGALEVSFERKALQTQFRGRASQVLEGAAQKLDAHAVHELEGNLSEELVGGLYYPGDAHITPPLLFRATYMAAERAGVEFLSGASVRSLWLETEEGGCRCRGVVLDDGSRLEADETVAAAGSWTKFIEGLPLAPNDVVPARGQIVELDTKRALLDRVVFGAGVYLIPRDEGKVLVGSTLEFVGFKKGVTAGGVRSLLQGALRLLPALAEAELSGSWSNFRPYTSDELPLLGRVGISGLVVASGHYRTGILLAPVTAKVVAALVLGRRPPVDLAPFDPLRRPSASPSLFSISSEKKPARRRQ